MEIAIFTDCRHLIENFVKNCNPRYQAFCKQWKDISFQNIYSAQTSTVELLQTTAAIFYIAKRAVTGKEGYERITGGVDDDQNQMLWRIGGLYLIYSVYFKQPTQQYVKVEVTLDVWQEIKNFVHSLSELPVAEEVRYIYLKLLQSKAFRFTAMEYCLGLEKLVDYKQINEEKNTEPMDFDERGSELKHDLYTLRDAESIIGTLVSLEKGYNDVKKKVIISTSNIDSTALPPTKIFSDIENVFQRFESILNESTDDTSVAKAEEDKSKHSLKQKGYQMTTNATKSETITTTINKKQKRAQRRMSARTVFKEQLPDAMLNDLEKCSTTNENTKQ